VIQFIYLKAVIIPEYMKPWGKQCQRHIVIAFDIVCHLLLNAIKGAIKRPATAGGLIHRCQANTPFRLFGLTEAGNFDLRQMEFFLIGALFHKWIAFNK